MTTKVTSLVLATTGVTARGYGTASQVPTFVVGADGRITSVSNTSIAIASGAVSGLAASATTDTTNASNISSGTLSSSRLSGTYSINISGNAGTATSATSASSATNATNLTGGTMSCSSGSITSAAPTLSFLDTDGNDFSVHVNSNLWYVLNQGSSATIYTDQSGNFTAVGNVTAYSDIKLKKNVTTISNALQTVNSLRGVRFEKDGKNGIGVIAQEVQNVLPEVVQENQDGYMSVAYGNMVGVLIEAIKELSAEVEELKKNKQNNQN